MDQDQLTDKNGNPIKKGDYIDCEWFVSDKYKTYTGRVTEISLRDRTFKATYKDGQYEQSIEEFQNYIVKRDSEAR